MARNGWVWSWSPAVIDPVEDHGYTLDRRASRSAWAIAAGTWYPSTGVWACRSSTGRRLTRSWPTKARSSSRVIAPTAASATARPAVASAAPVVSPVSDVVADPGLDPAANPAANPVADPRRGHGILVLAGGLVGAGIS